MRKNFYWILFLNIITIIWMYNLYYFIYDVKNEKITFWAIVGNIVVNIYVFVSIIYVVYLKFWKKD